MAVFLNLIYGFLIEFRMIKFNFLLSSNDARSWIHVSCNDFGLIVGTGQ